MMNRLLKWLGEVWDWIRCHTFSCYHLLDLRDRGEGHGYKWGWMDRDHLMLIACFTLLRDFVEKENPKIGLLDVEAYYDYDYEPSLDQQAEIEAQIDAGKEIRDLYKWWVAGRAKEHAEVAVLIEDTTGFEGMAIVNHPKFAEWSCRHDELEAKDDAQLLRLIKIRGHLWT